MKEGWLCPICLTINAPFVLKCECKKKGSNDKDQLLVEKKKRNES